MEKAKEIYKQGFIKYIDEIIDFNKYDLMIENSLLYFGQAKSHKENIKSKYYSLLNDFYVEKLSEEHKIILEKKEQIDEETINIVKSTYKEVLKKGEYENIMYNPPLPEHHVKNGSLVLEFVYGKNVQTFSKEEYAELVKKQRNLIEEVNNELKKEISEKLNISVVVFVEKRI